MCMCVLKYILWVHIYVYVETRDEHWVPLSLSNLSVEAGFPLSLELTDSVYMTSDPRDPAALTPQLSWLQTQLTSPGCSHVFWDPNSGLRLMQQTLL